MPLSGRSGETGSADGYACSKVKADANPGNESAPMIKAATYGGAQ